LSEGESEGESNVSAGMNMNNGAAQVRNLIGKVILVTGLLLMAFPGLAAQAADLQGADKNKRLRVLLPHDNKPLSYIHEGEPRGIYVDMLEAIANSQKLELDIQLVSFARAYQLMLSSNADVAIAHSVLKMERSGAIYLPYSKDIKVSFFTLQDNEIEIHQESDLWRYKIGAQRIIPDLQFQGARVFHFKAPSYQVKALKAGRVELIIMTEAAIPYWEKAYNVRLKRVHRYRSNKISLWFNAASLGESNKEYCLLFAQGFIELRQAKELTKLAAKYNTPMVKKLLRSGSDDTSYNCVNSVQ